MSLIAQAKLLRVLEERRFERLGGQQVDLGRLPPDLRDQPPARAVRPRRPVPRRPLLPRQRLRDPAAVAARTAGRHPGARAAIPRPLLRGAGAAARQQGVFARSARPARQLPLAGQHPRARKHGVARGAVGARAQHPRLRHRVPARDGAVGDPVRRSAAVARRGGARAHRAGARSRAVEQEGGGARARHQPRHAVPQDRRVQPRAGAAHGRSTPDREQEA